MRTRHPLKLTIAATVAGVLAAAAPAMAAPVSAGIGQLRSTATSDVEPVRWRGHGGGGVAAGIAAGMLLGGMIAASPYYYGPPGPPPYYAPGYYGPVYPYYAPDDYNAYCFSRYRSFDPQDGTYLGYDGRRHPCR